ncbi:MFS transporter [Paraburkholderia megapolitana]|uniref:MFS transporter n=1 Tax=Paraburkholderia megapolitana TaxID=420953 RepID=UPI0038BB86FF
MLTVILCISVAVLDGFDTQAIGFLAPAIARSLALPLPAFGSVFTAGLAGLMIGAITLGPLADRFGRKKMLVLATLAFGVFAFTTAFAHTLPQLLVMRFLTGLGLGGAMPNVVALASEFSPRRLARVCVTVLFCGMPAGAVVGGLVSAALLPRYGWHSVFYVGGALPVAVALAVAIWMPESVRYLTTLSSGRARARKIMFRIAPELAQRDIEFISGEIRHGGVPLRHLFTEGRAARTILLWIPYFMNLLVLYFVISWLPAVMIRTGSSITVGIQAITAFSMGGVVGSLIQGRLMDRFGLIPVLFLEFLFYIGFVVVLATQPLGVAGILVATGLAGIAVQGAQAGLNSLAAEIYPTSMRGTGVGCALAVGRIGSILGPIAGSLMLAFNWNAQQIFLTGVIPGAIAAAAILCSRRFGYR